MPFSRGNFLQKNIFFILVMVVPHLLNIPLLCCSPHHLSDMLVYSVLIITYIFTCTLTLPSFTFSRKLFIDWSTYIPLSFINTAVYLKILPCHILLITFGKNVWYLIPLIIFKTSSTFSSYLPFVNVHKSYLYLVLPLVLCNLTKCQPLYLSLN